MADPSLVYQRSHSGREEIHKKTHGLTQSERLVLIMIDGVSSHQALRSKLPVLTDERFDKALRKLCAKELVHEVLLPMEGQPPDELDRVVIDRFLQQDPLDPVTILLRDPEEDLEYQVSAAVPAPALHRQEASDVPDMVVPDSSAIPELTTELALPNPSPLGRIPAMDALHNALADSLAQEVRARQPERQARLDRSINAAAEMFEQEASVESDSMFAPVKSVHWGYWLIAVGIGFLVGYTLAKLGS